MRAEKLQEISSSRMGAKQSRKLPEKITTAIKPATPKQTIIKQNNLQIEQQNQKHLDNLKDIQLQIKSKEFSFKKDNLMVDLIRNRKTGGKSIEEIEKMVIDGQIPYLQVPSIETQGEKSIAYWK